PTGRGPSLHLAWTVYVGPVPAVLLARVGRATTARGVVGRRVRGMPGDSGRVLLLVATRRLAVAASVVRPLASPVTHEACSAGVGAGRRRARSGHARAHRQLPLAPAPGGPGGGRAARHGGAGTPARRRAALQDHLRSEERRVGKECSSRS